MSDPKRATLITVGAPKSEKNKVNKTVRLTINLDESNESKYPELNYKELVIAEEKIRSKKVENGKTEGLNPFSDNDDDVERVARKFEQKYGSNKTSYGQKGRSKRDDFADIGAGYDENDSFIDNTDGYDEMIPPESDTFYGGFYINSGALEFKNVEGESAYSDAEPGGNRRNKRRISSSSSEEESSDSSTDSESQDEKDAKAIANGEVDSHKTEHRKKKNKNIEKKAKTVRRTDSSAATSGKQTSDDNGHPDSDSRTSQSDSLTSKPAPSSENAITSDSSRDIEAKSEVNLPAPITQILEEFESVISRLLMDKSNTPINVFAAKTDSYISKLEVALKSACVEAHVREAALRRATRALAGTRDKRPWAPVGSGMPATATIAQPTTANVTTNNKRKYDDEEDLDMTRLTDAEREDKIVETLQRLKALIDERKPGMMANYNAECERVQEERKKIQIASATEGTKHIEKRLPKRRFPWCPRSRALLARLKRLAGSQDAAAILLAKRALPLFPEGFVRMPTLLRQADLSKDMKVAEIKRQRLGSTSQSAPQLSQVQFTEPPIQFPSSLTVTTMKVSPEKNDVSYGTDEKDSKYKNSNSVFCSIMNSFTLSKDLVVEKQDERKKELLNVDKVKEDLYIPPNNIGSITITPVPNQQKHEKKANNVIEKQKEALIRVKSPAALNAEMVTKDKDKVIDNVHRRDKDKHKKDKPIHNVQKEKRVDTPLHIDTSYQTKQKEPAPSPKNKEEISQRQIDNMRIAENNIPRPALVPVHHSPTFAKPDKRPPEVKKKKDLVIVSDVDPLGDLHSEPLAIDDSSSDVELIEDNKSEKKSGKSDSVPSKDKVSVPEVNHKKVDSARVIKDIGDRKDEKRSETVDTTKEDFASLMQNLRDLEHSQEAAKYNHSFGVITSAKHAKSSSQSFNSRNPIFGTSRSDKDKLSEHNTKQNTKNNELL